MEKNICIFSANYLPSLGGVERYTYNLAKKLIYKGYKVIVITSNINNLADYEVVENIEIYRLPCYKVLNGRFPILKYNKNFKRLNKLLESKNIDFTIVNTRFYLHSLYGVKFANKVQSPVITIEHGTNHFTVNNKLLDLVGHFYEHLITLHIKKCCKNFYGVSEACNLWLKHFNIKAKSTLYNAIDIEEINRLLESPIHDYKAKYKKCKDDIIITYTGRLVKEKGILKLIDAVKQVNDSYNYVNLFIAGDGDLSDEVIRKTDSHIIYLGRINFESIISLLKQTDIFCLPTDYPEGFPTSVLEAAACKCFTITTKSGGSKELYINNDYGIILEENSVSEIRDSIIKVINNKHNMENAVDIAYNRLKENFTWDIVAEKVIDIYNYTKGDDYDGEN